MKTMTCSFFDAFQTAENGSNFLVDFCIFFKIAVIPYFVNEFNDLIKVLQKVVRIRTVWNESWLQRGRNLLACTTKKSPFTTPYTKFHYHLKQWNFLKDLVVTSIIQFSFHHM